MYWSHGGGTGGSKYFLKNPPQFSFPLVLPILPFHLGSFVLKWTQGPIVIQLEITVRHFLLFLESSFPLPRSFVFYPAFCLLFSQCDYTVAILF